MQTSPSSSSEPAIACGYQPGVIGRVAEMHALFYARHYGFGQFFESQVASGMAEFASRLANSRNALWTATRDGRAIGSIAIDGEHGHDTAHLRWFIVDASSKGSGIGRRLLSDAIAFCDRQGFQAIQLWTFSGLEAARSLYENFGFSLVEERVGTQWGTEVTEQRFVRHGRSRGASL